MLNLTSAQSTTPAMKSIIAYSLICVIALASALSLRNNNTEKYVVLPITYQMNDDFLLHINSSLEERDMRAIPLYNLVDVYKVAVSIGSPEQALIFDISTACSNTWVFAAGTPGAEKAYNQSESSTYLTSEFSFDKESFWERTIGSWVTETVTIGDAILENQSLGVVTSIFERRPRVSLDALKRETGVLCLGYEPAAETSLSEPASVLRNLRDQGYISRMVYSLSFGSSMSLGSLIFGAVDAKKYTGRLKTIKPTRPRTLRVNVANISVGEGQLFGSFETNIDCSIYFSFLPLPAVYAIAQFYGAQWDPSLRAFVLDELPVTPFKFTFGEIVIAVQPFDIFTRLFGPGYRTHYILTIFSNLNSKGENILGINFLRSAFVVFDLERHEISMAQARFNPIETNIIPIVDDVPRDAYPW